MPFPSFSNPFTNKNHLTHNLSSSTSSKPVSPNHQQSYPIQPSSPSSSTPATSPNYRRSKQAQLNQSISILKPINLNSRPINNNNNNNNNNNGGSSATRATFESNSLSNPRYRTQSLANSTFKTSYSIQSHHDQPASSSESSSHLIKKLKSYGSTVEKSNLIPKRKFSRPPPLSLQIDHHSKNPHQPLNRPRTASSTKTSFPSPRSRSASAAATVFEIVRPGRRRDGAQTSSSFTPPLPPKIGMISAPQIQELDHSIYLQEPRLEVPLRLPLKSNPTRFDPGTAQLTSHCALNSRPSQRRRASSLDSSSPGLLSPIPSDQLCSNTSGFIENFRKFSACSSGLSYYESSEEIISPSSLSSSAQTSPLSSKLWAGFSPREARQVLLKPQTVHSNTPTSLSPRPQLPSRSSKPTQAYSPKSLEPLESNPPTSPSNSWILELSSAVNGEPTTYLVPDLVGTIFRLKQHSTTSRSTLEPNLQKKVVIGPDGNELIEWDIKLTLPAPRRLNNPFPILEGHESPTPSRLQPGGFRARTVSRPRRVSKVALTSSPTKSEKSLDGSGSNDSDLFHNKGELNPSISVTGLNLTTFKPSDVKDFMTAPSLKTTKSCSQLPKTSGNDSTDGVPDSLSMLFSSSTSPPTTPRHSKNLTEQPRSSFRSRVSSTSSCLMSSSSSSSSSSSAEVDLEATDDDTKEKAPTRRKRVNTFVSSANPKTPNSAQQTSLDYISVDSARLRSRKKSFPKVVSERELVGINYRTSRTGSQGNESQHNPGVLPLNLERELARQKLIGLPNQNSSPSESRAWSDKYSSDHSKSKGENERPRQQAAHLKTQAGHHHDNNRYPDRNSATERSYWSETDTTDSSVVNVNILNEDEDD